MTVHSPEELVLSAWSAVSPFGLGAAAFTDGLASGQATSRAVDRRQWGGPYEKACLIPGFDLREHVGRKGTRAMDRATGISVATVGLLLDSCGPDLTADLESVGLVLGTGSGSVQSIVDFTKESMLGEKPYHVDPARFPNTVMNRAAGQSAIWWGLKGPNSTISGGALTGLLALNYARRLLRAGRCTQVLCGAVEEFSEQRGWLEWHSSGSVRTLGEGCAVFLLESAADAAKHGRTPHATLLGSGFAAFPEPGMLTETLATCIVSTLKRAGHDPSDVRAVVTSGRGDVLGRHEQDAVAAALGPGERSTVDTMSLLGDTSSASASFQIAALLATPGEAGVGLVTSVDRAGTTGCTVLLLPGA
jgi:3-oxoacyl-[acyl-carrier-protein] synthase II